MTKTPSNHAPGHPAAFFLRLLLGAVMIAAACNAAQAQSFGVVKPGPPPMAELGDLSADDVAAIMRQEALPLLDGRGSKQRASPLKLNAKVQACTDAGSARLQAWLRPSSVMVADARGGGYAHAKTSDKFGFKASFASGSVEVSAADIAELGKVAAGMNQSDLKQAQFLIEGHANKTGPAPLNYKITCQRAINLRQILVERYGVSADRIDVVGMGFDELIPRLDEADAAHRRAEFRYRWP